MASLLRSSGHRSLTKFLDQFWLQTFEPVLHDTPATLLFVLPYLFGITDEEWIEEDRLSGPAADPVLLQCPPGYWRLRANVGGAEDNADGDSEAAEPSGDFQRKIQPWIFNRPDASLAEDIGTERLPRRADHDLILVASLVDKATNLGGLARTSEIFGVRELVVSNLRVIKDPNFVSLSVTAHKWLHMTEVPEQLLGDFLTEKLRAGYTLVGVEQTANSVPLQEFHFPQKTVLLLGHERSGIPVDLINRLSVCVEIPQSGIVRSLNVHVTGAIVVWEFTRQLLIAADSAS